ncbi:MAG: DUF4136 domain-containing protein [Desulfuromonadales bacterium]|jgi:hypothetical protein
MRSIWLFIMTVFIFGCSTVVVPSVETDRNDQFDFSSLRTFRFVAEQGTSSVEAKYLPRVQQTLRTSLEEKGYVYTTSAADFSVLTRINVENKVITIEDTAHLRRSLRAADGAPMSVRLREGALLISMTNDDSPAAIFTGTAKTQVNEASSPEKTDKLIDQAVRLILEDFPRAQ